MAMGQNDCHRWRIAADELSCGAAYRIRIPTQPRIDEYPRCSFFDEIHVHHHRPKEQHIFRDETGIRAHGRLQTIFASCRAGGWVCSEPLEGARPEPVEGPACSSAPTIDSDRPGQETKRAR